jgi:hypothetical protein
MGNQKNTTMLKNKITLIIFLSLSSAMLMVACDKDFLKQDTTGLLTEDQAQTKKGAEQFLIGAYAKLKGDGADGWQGGGFNWVYGSIVGGDANKGSDAGDQANIVPIQQYVALPTNNFFDIKWSVLYEGIARSNITIRIVTKLTSDDILDEEKNQILAEARFLRGFYHFEAKKMWNKIPYVDETIGLENPKVPNTEDAWPKIMDDLKFAMDNLAVIPDAVGRINKWGAAAMYAKALLFQGKYAEARPIFTDVINNGRTSGDIKYDLAPAFHDLFNAERETDPAVRAESIFAYEASINDGSAGANANFDQILNFPYNAGPGGCCGFFQPSFEFVNSFRTSAAGLPLLDGSYNTGANQVKNDQGLESTDPFTPDAGNLDPRIDWTVGRRGIPFLDWGIYPGKSWIRDQGNGGPYAPKKNAYYEAQEGKFTDGTSWTSGLTSTNYKILRFADVLLMAAEAEIDGGGSLDKAREYVNMVRERASRSASFVKNDAGNPAANYVIGLYDDPWSVPDDARNAVRFERKLELGMEGHRFFDLVRWGIADVAINAFLTYEKVKLSAGYGSATFAKGKNEYYPIPQTQIDLHTTNGVSNLEQNPGY